MKLNIALLSGGDSSEREISIRSAGQIAKNLDTQKYNIFLIDVNKSVWSYKTPSNETIIVNQNDFSITIDDQKIAFDYALILIHGTPGEDGRIQGYLDMKGIPYSSCDMVSSVVTFDKTLCKSAVRPTGISLSREILIRKDDQIDTKQIVEKLGLPIFVKPNASGSSFGVTKVKSEAEIASAIDSAFKEGDAVLIEEFIEGREYACGLMITKDKQYVFPIAEVVSKREFFDYTAKYTDGMADEIIPAQISEELSDLIKSNAVKAYKACNCRGVVRIDFIVKNSVPYMIEINSIPGMSENSILPKQLRSVGMSIGELYDIIISNTIDLK